MTKQANTITAAVMAVCSMGAAVRCISQKSTADTARTVSTPTQIPAYRRASGRRRSPSENGNGLPSLFMRVLPATGRSPGGVMIFPRGHPFGTARKVEEEFSEQPRERPDARHRA